MHLRTHLILLSVSSSLVAGAETNLVFKARGNPALEYRCDPAAFKPYVAQLYTPSGVAVLRDSPADHKHHHGLMFACGVDGVDFWSETAACGRQIARTTAGEPANGPDRVLQTLAWTAKDGKVMLEETRKVRLEPSTGYTLVTWDSRLTPPQGTSLVRLTGSSYFGLGVRFVASADGDAATIRTADKAEGESVRGTEKLTATRWIACSATAGDKPFTLAVFDAPDNARHPTLMFSMKAPFAYLSATRNLHRDPLPISAGEVRTLVHGIAVWDGFTPDEAIEEAYKAWVENYSR